MECLIYIYGKVSAMLRALMSRKTRKAYDRVLSAIADIVLNLRPSNMITDFEGALQEALIAMYPKATLQGCFFHYCHVDINFLLPSCIFFLYSYFLPLLYFSITVVALPWSQAFIISPNK